MAASDCFSDIDPNALYEPDSVAALVSCDPAMICRQMGSGNLHYARPGNRMLIRGQWIFDWLDMIGRANASPACVVGGQHDD